jgi:DNA-binding NarL/FixJ family response regulator
MRVVVADDSALIRDGLTKLLPAHGFEVAATAADVEALLASIEQVSPDVALVDIRMPPTFTNERIATATIIRERHPSVGVLVLSQYIDADYALSLIRTHPTRCGYLLKDRITTIEILVGAIGRVTRGQTVVDPELVELLLSRPSARSRLADLTPRELEVLSLVAQGLTDRGIGERLWLTPKTVETHIRHLLAKLDLPVDTTLNRRVLAVLTYLRDEHGLPSPARRAAPMTPRQILLNSSKAC